MSTLTIVNQLYEIVRKNAFEISFLEGLISLIFVKGKDFDRILTNWKQQYSCERYFIIRKQLTTVLLLYFLPADLLV